MKKYISRIILIIFIFCTSLSIISFIWTLTNSNIYLDLSNKGIKDFYNYYQSTILLLGIGITLLTLWATFERINQTEKQLNLINQQVELITSQNTFNNFFIHRKEFINTFKENIFIKEIGKANECEPQVLLSEFYSLFYYKTHINFSPRINAEFLQTLEVFYNDIKNSILNKNGLNFMEVDVLELNAIRKKIPGEILIPIFRFSQHIQRKVLANENLSLFIQKKKLFSSFEFILLNDVFYSIKLVILLMTFDGIIKKPLNYLTECIYALRMEFMETFNIYNEF